MERRRYPLDTVALLFPATASKNWRNINRHEAELNEPVDPDILQQALDDLAERFPLIFVSLDNTKFEYFLRPCDERLLVRLDTPRPLMPMSEAEARVSCMRILHGHRTIAMEPFHAVADGQGATVFFCTLLARYLSLKHAIEVPSGMLVKDVDEAPRAGEMADGFLEHAGKFAGMSADEPSYVPQGKREPDGLLHVTTGIVDTAELIAAARRHGVTVTSFASAVMVQTVMELQDLEVPRKRQKRVNITVAADLRRLFESETLRNFTMAQNPGIDPRLGEYSFDDICTSLDHQIQLGLTVQNMAAFMASAVRIRKNPAFRLAPLPLKNAAFNIVFTFRGENCGCMSMPNLGKVNLPTEMEPYIESFNVILGPPRNGPYNCSYISYGGKTRFNITRTVRETRLEERFFLHLKEQGVAADVSCDGVPMQLP